MSGYERFLNEKRLFGGEAQSFENFCLKYGRQVALYLLMGSELETLYMRWRRL